MNRYIRNIFIIGLLFLFPLLSYGQASDIYKNGWIDLCRYGPANATVKTVYQGIKDYLPKAQLEYAKGCDIIDRYLPESELYDIPLDTDEQKIIDEAVALALKSDVAIMVYNTGTPVILLLVDGRAATINWAEKFIPGILII